MKLFFLRICVARHQKPYFIDSGLLISKKLIHSQILRGLEPAIVKSCILGWNTRLFWLRLITQKQNKNVYSNRLLWTALQLTQESFVCPSQISIITDETNRGFFLPEGCASNLNATHYGAFRQRT